MYRKSKPTQVDPTTLKNLRLRIDCEDLMFPSLKKLKLKGKDLDSVPPELYSITELEVLDLSPEREACMDYHLTYIDPRISNLVNLRFLALDTNRLREVPDALSHLVNLERLSLSNNLLRSLPDSLRHLKRLESLHVSNNKISHFSPALCQLSSLRFLDMSDNLLVRLPDEIRELQNLEALILVYNKLERLPDTLCDMINLHVLWIGYNKITRLPQGFGRLRNLDWGFRHTSSLTIDGNPIQHPPPKICKKGVEAIARYLSGVDSDEN